MTKRAAKRWAALLWEGRVRGVNVLPYRVRVSLFRSGGFRAAAKWLREFADALEKK